jgi:Fe-S cluster assembly iron-binding protein IscA
MSNNNETGNSSSSMKTQMMSLFQEEFYNKKSLTVVLNLTINYADTEYGKDFKFPGTSTCKRSFR